MFLVAVLSCLIISGCTDSDDRLSEVYPDENLVPIVVPLNTDSGYKINPATGDSIPQDIIIAGKKVRTGIPLPARFVSIDSGKIAPKQVPAGWSAKRLVISNVIPFSGSPVQIPVDESKLKHFVTGVDTSSFVLIGKKGDTIPTGVPLPANGVKSVCRLPIPQDAFPISRSDKAFFDMQFLEAYHGLKSRNINYVMEDSRGLIWICTFDALSCYDGKQFRHFTTSNGLLRNSVHYMMEDSKGRIWLDYGDGKVTSYDGQGFTHYTDGSNRMVIYGGNNSILEDREGKIWFRNMAGGLTRFDGRTFTYLTRKEGMNSNAVRCMMQDSKGNFWIGTHGAGISKYDGKSFTWFTKQDGLNHNIVSAIVEDRNGIMWFGTDSGITRYDGRAFTQYYQKDGLSDNLVGSAVMDNKGVLWFGTYLKGLTRYDGRNFTQVTEREGIPVNRINKLTKDSQGNLWLATESGAFYLRTGNFIRYDMTNAGFNGTLSTIIETSGKKSLLGAKGLHLFDFQSLQTLKDRDSLSDTQIIDILVDKKGNTWFGTPNGLFRFDGHYIHQFTTLQGLPHNLISCLLEDSKGMIWIGTHKGICRFDGNKIYQLKDESGMMGNWIVNIFEDGKGDVYISNSNGFSIFDGKNLTHLTRREGLLDDFIRDIREDRYGSKWLSTSAGICRFDGRNFLCLTEKQGLPNKFIGATWEDSSGNLWVEHLKGLSMLPLEYIDFCRRFSENPGLSTNSLPSLIHFSSSDGIPDYILSASLENKNRLRMISSNNREEITELDLSELKGELKKPGVRIQDLRLLGRSMDFRNLSGNDSQQIQFNRIDAFTNIPVELTLPHNYNQVTFYFTTERQAVVNRIMYSYRMVGLNQNWSTPSRENKAHYQYLPPGNYTLQVRASADNNNWSEPASFVFDINPPWWQTWWAYSIAALMFFSLIFLYTRYRSQALSLQNVKLEGKVNERTEQLTKSIRDLKETQAQLIQSEKMASLGELTAGIAHEIQNPLNFVNNFSDVNQDLIDELKEEIDKGNIREVKIIADDIKENETKINLHGKRAGAIVKGMLQHSRVSSGQKEPTDINALCDEYLRLAHHGLKAKDKSFNCTIETDFDPAIGKVNIIPQEIGRVLLNLYNNAFYAVNEKMNKADKNYEPKVTIRTSLLQPTENPLIRQSANSLIIAVKDNGNGIPQKVLDKIFQPFFTTKPTGQGTGLGLSLSYDIVKAHGGEIEVESHEGMGTSFKIQLPIGPKL